MSNLIFLGNYASGGTPLEVEDLAIFPIIERLGLSSIESVTDIDIQLLLGIEKDKWTYDRGKKDIRPYGYTGENNTIINVANIKWYYPNETDREIVDYYKSIIYLDNSGNPCLEKLIKARSLSITNIEDVNTGIRTNRIGFLRAAAKNLEAASQNPLLPSVYQQAYAGLSAAIFTILHHYDVEINLYLRDGAMDFENKITFDKDNGPMTNDDGSPSIRYLLNLRSEQPNLKFPLGLVAAESALYQLNGTIPR